MKQLIGLITILFFVACSKEEPVTPVTPLPPVNNDVKLSELKAGQSSVYLHYHSSCENFNGNFSYTGNTITLTILEEDGKLYAQEDYYYKGVDTSYITTYEVYNEGKFVVIPERWNSSLFNFYDNDRIDMEPESRIGLEQNGCQIFHSDKVFEGNDIGVLDNFKIGDIEEEDLTLVSCEPILEVEGYLMYDDNRLIASHVIHIDGWSEPFPTSIQGWILRQ